MPKRSYVLAMLLVLLVLPAMVWGFDDEFSRETLRGFKSVYLNAGGLEPEIERKGFTNNQIITDIEIKLRMVELKILTDTEWKVTPKKPALSVEVTVNMLPFSKSIPFDVYSYSITVDFTQEVFLMERTNPVHAITWSTGYHGTTPYLTDIRDRVKSQIDIFINAFLSVNPKK